MARNESFQDIRLDAVRVWQEIVEAFTSNAGRVGTGEGGDGAGGERAGWEGGGEDFRRGRRRRRRRRMR